MQFFWISGISSTFSPTAVLSSNHIERKEAANTLFLEKLRPHWLCLLSNTLIDVCLSLAEGLDFSDVTRALRYCGVRAVINA